MDKETSVAAAAEPTRGQKIWQRLRDRRDKEPVSFARAKIVTRSYKATLVAPGLFEEIHYLCSMTAALEYLLS